jgi:hypothetical protein
LAAGPLEQLPVAALKNHGEWSTTLYKDLEDLSSSREGGWI